MTDINIEEIANEVAHRTCTKYVHDGELRYQFNDRHVVDFATRIIAAVDKARAEQNRLVAWREASCGDDGTCCYTYNEIGIGEPLCLCRQTPTYKENEECSVAPLADGESVNKVDFSQWFKDKGD